MISGTEVDVVVIGGGPAGATTSTLIAEQGYRVELFEREHFPRFHIGESLIPETYWVLRRLGMLEKMKQSHFVKKVSVQFMNARGRLSEPFYFMDNRPHECSLTWQVYRQEFDHMMLKNAAEKGVRVHFGRFVKRNPHLKGHLTDLLVGDLFDEKVDDVIPPLDEFRAEMNAESHVGS